MSKAISRFLPTPSRTPEECERHYTSVHMRMAQNFLRPMTGLQSYHVNRALSQADIGGGWAQRPRAWRFAIVRFDPGAVLDFSPEQAELVAQDHVSCLYRLRHCSLEEKVLLDRRSAEQLTLAKFMIEADRAAGVSAEAAWEAFEGLAAHVRELMADAFGARLLLLNRALDEVECEPVDVEGQRPIGLLEQTLRVGYLEAYFDHRRWGEEALGVLASDGSLRDSSLADVNLLHLEELAALELR
jgi:hypothetical protein